jgi:hypothetical protein
VFSDLSVRWYNELESAREEEDYSEGGSVEEDGADDYKRIDNLLEQLRQLLL